MQLPIKVFSAVVISLLISSSKGDASDKDRRPIVLESDDGNILIKLDISQGKVDHYRYFHKTSNSTIGGSFILNEESLFGRYGGQLNGSFGEDSSCRGQAVLVQSQGEGKASSYRFIRNYADTEECPSSGEVVGVEVMRLY